MQSLKALKSYLIEFLNIIKNEKECGYKHCNNAYHSYSVDATTLGIDLCHMLGIQLMDDSDAINKLLRYQDPASGFFYESFAHNGNLNEPRIEEIVGTYTSFQIAGILNHYRYTPFKPFEFYNQYISEGSFYQYCSKFMPWNSAPTGAGGMVDHAATMVKNNIMRGDKIQQRIIDEMVEWANRNQSKSHGLWGSKRAKGTNGLVIAGYHLMRGLHFNMGLIPQYPDKIIDTTLASIDQARKQSFDSCNGCFDLDHFFILERMCEFTENNYRQNEIRTVSEERYELIIKNHFIKPGFTFNRMRSIRRHYEYMVSPGEPTPDIVGSVFYLETICRIHRILNLDFGTAINSSITHGC